MKASDLFVKCLETEGVEKIFGIPGEENADMMMSLENSSIEFILCRHEQSAAFMVDVYGRLTGKAAVCLGTLGPGATNLVTGVADGNMDRAPMIVVTGQGSTERLHKESHQAMDNVELFKPITKWARQIIHANNIPEVVRKAFKIAEMEKPGACHIELPENIAKEQTETTPILPKKVRRPVPDKKIIGQTLQAIRDAKRPVILAGNGAIRKRASQQLHKFASSTGIGVINTFMGKGALDMDDPNCLYTIGLQQHDQVACAIDAADVVITIGYDMVEYHPRLWNPDADKTIVHFDFLPAEVDHHYRIKVEVVGDLAHALWMLNEAVADEPLRFDTKSNAAVRREMQAEFAMHADDDTEGLIKPQKVLWDVRKVMGTSDILLSDVGAHKMWIARYYQCHEPNTCLISNGFCTMGFALPGAMGAQIAHPDRRVMAICGDAGFLMNVQEMETIRRYNINIVALVWEDHEYGLIKWKQQNEFGKHTPLRFENPDWLKLAESFDWYSARVENSSDLESELEKAFQANKPALVVVPIDYAENTKLTERLGNIACPI